MIDKRRNCIIFDEMKDSPDDMKYWFDFTKQKFLHNIDTFYYSVKLKNNFSKFSEESCVVEFREYFKNLDPGSHKYDIPVDLGQSMQLNYSSKSFAGIYDICLECPEYFDIFIASWVPSVSADSDDTVTSEILVQIRSCLLWELGPFKAYEYSFQAITSLCSKFDFDIDEVKENRIDYCWHTNYLQNPETYLRIDNMLNMIVTRLGRKKNERGHRMSYMYSVVPGEYAENDYISLGSRGDKCFLRIYLKSKEVVQMGYKPWFLKIWLFNKLINRYDFYVLEYTYRSGKWQDLDLNRLRFYYMYGKDSTYKEEIEKILSSDMPDLNRAAILADKLTPKITSILNVEFQTSRKHTKNYILLPFKDNEKYGIQKRIYYYFDNHKMIIEYLTHELFRLIDVTSDSNRSRCDYNPFWKALRNTKLVDCYMSPDELKLYRDYSRVLNADMVKKRAVNSIVTHELYKNGLNNRNVMDDVIDFMTRLNDNDIHDMKKYKNKKVKLLNSTELGDKPVGFMESRYIIIDKETGEELSGLGD